MKAYKAVLSFLFGALLLCTASGAMAQAGITSIYVKEVTKTNMPEVLNPSTATKDESVFVLACDKSAADCQEAMEQFSMTSLKAKGGWLGPGANKTQFYFLDSNAVNLKDLDSACKASGMKGTGWSVCDSKLYKEPIGFMYRIDGQDWRRDFFKGNDFSDTLRHFTTVP